MALADYEVLWTESHSRFVHNDSIVQQFKLHAQEIGLDNVTSFLSVGTGTGNIECELVKSCLPNIKNFYAVDTEDKLLTIVQKKIDSLKKDIESAYVCSTLHEYNGPGRSVDLILLSHVIYYKGDTMENTLRKYTDMLSPGGAMVVVIGTSRTKFKEELKKAFGRVGTGMHAGLVCDALTNLGMSWKEHQSKEVLLIHKGDGLEELVEVFIEKTPTPDDVDKFLSVARNYSLPGRSDACEVGQSFIVVKKERG